MKKVLITDGVHPLLMDGLERAGFSCDYQPDISLEKVRAIIADYSGLIINSKILVDKILLDEAEQLEFVGRLGSGMEIIDREYAALKKVAVYNSPEGNRNAVAEHALGMLLALSNKLISCDRELRSKIWRREANRGFEISSKILGIIGFGHTGSMFASKFSGLAVKVLAYDKYKTAYAEPFPFVISCAIEQIWEEADIISLHLPLNAETHHMVDSDFLSKCKDGVILINTSRGPIVNTLDLMAGLQSGKVAGACLDVFENEKPTSFTQEEANMYESLYSLDNVILSPHVAGWTHESKMKLARILLEKILSGFKH